MLKNQDFSKLYMVHYLILKA